jgi:hypothetical protein
LATAQARPQVPQFASDVVSAVSQPLLVSPSQLPKPVLQAATWHAPLTHAGIAAGSEHARPHAPQFATEVVSGTSQPLLTCRSQSAKPAVQLPMEQLLAAHTGAALGVAQARPQPPQCEVLVARFDSQPLASLPSHSPKPGRQVLSQRPSTHAGMALPRVGHTLLHAPQCAGLARRSVSQPLPGSLSQSAKPCPQVATAHEPLTHAGVPPETVQRFAQRPQCGRLLRVSTSQPLLASPSQSAKPASQVKPQAPDAQAARALARAGRRCRRRRSATG